MSKVLYLGTVEIKKKIDTKTREFMDKMTKLATQGKALIVDPDKPLKDYLENTLKVLLPYFGDVEEFDYCFVCQRNTPPRYRYLGLGHYDVQHAINARECSGNEIMSFDKGFSQLQNIREFDSLKITVL